MKIKITTDQREFIGKRVANSLIKYSLINCTLLEIMETAYLQGMFDASEAIKETKEGG